MPELSQGVRVQLLGGFQVEVAGRAVADGAWPSRRSARTRGAARAVGTAPPDAGSGRRRAVAAPRAGRRCRQPAQGRAPCPAGAGPRRRGGAERRDGGAVPRLGDARPTRASSTGARRRPCGPGTPPSARPPRPPAGILLPDSLYEEWTQAARARLHGLELDLLRRAGEWERVALAEPADEPAHLELMRAALADGNRHAAIRWYGRLRTNLERELGLPPSPAVQALYAECVEGLGRTGAAFVGRQVELARVSVALRAALAGQVGALVLRGPGGIGKSALCRQAAAAASAQGWLVVSAQASLVTSPYGPLVDVVEQLLRRDRTPAGRRRPRRAGDPRRADARSRRGPHGPRSASPGTRRSGPSAGWCRRAGAPPASCWSWTTCISPTTRRWTRASTSPGPAAACRCSSCWRSGPTPPGRR